MGSRSRSIRLRIYFLVAIPLVTMIGLLTYVVTTSVHNAINLGRAPKLVNATSVPTADFVKYLQAERLAAVVYLFQPNQVNLAAYQAAIKQTEAAQPTFISQMDSSATQTSATASSKAGIQQVIDGLKQLPALRQGVEKRMLANGQLMTALDGLSAYSKGIQAEPTLFLDEAASMTDATAASQALGLIATVSAREALSQEDALLSGMLAADKASPADRAAFTQMAATRQGDLVDADAIFNSANLAIFNAALNGTQTQQQELTQIEGAVAGGAPMAKLPVNLPQWQGLTGTLLQDYYTGGTKDAQAQVTVDSHTGHIALVRAYLFSGIALFGLLLTILVTTLVGQSIIRRLRGLETSARQLAERQLPEVIGRLRRGDDVNVAIEAPPLRVGGDEIGRVGQAFDLVRQTAIRSAVEESKLRRGFNDVFRSLARRSQSLLHRQLTLLDQMERRATDPEALDDLFRLDHLTTRMRRHAEGLIILAGASAGRGWSSPVRMVDVMRGAIAEVEDYARVSVATRSQAALSGSAVADVIHLLAELIENATTLSPPYTSVQVSGDTVANGFAIEVEDRGLGITKHRLIELNERLANPPEFNPSDSEQLGLFVVGQLAKRHGIRVTLKASPYGGTDAVVLIPRNLVVAEEAFRASLPGEPPAAITSGPPKTNGNHFAVAHISGGPAFAEPPGLDPKLAADAQLTGGPRISGALRRAHGTFPDKSGKGGNSTGDVTVGHNGDSLPRRERSGRPSAAVRPPSFDMFSPGTAAADPAGPPFGAAPRPKAQANTTLSFPGRDGQSASATPMTPVPSGGAAADASSGSGKVSKPPWELSPDTGLLPVIPGIAEPVMPDGDGDRDFKGLPRRVRQANLAPQLRAEPAPQQRGDQAAAGNSGGSGQPGGPSPEEIRATMSALQRGLQEGRSQRATGGLPPWERESAPEEE